MSQVPASPPPSETRRVGNVEQTGDRQQSGDQQRTGDQQQTGDQQRTGDPLAADSLAVGMAVMLAMTIVQRGLGFGRGIWFCRLMSDADVGSLSMAQDFIVMMTPIAMMGIPGCLARYVEQFRKRGQLTPMVGRLAVITTMLGCGLVAGLLFAPEFFGWLIFLQSDATDLILAVACGVAAIVAYNFVYELCASLRQVRMASWMQFIQSVGFSVLGIAWLYAGGTLSGLVGVFAVVTVAAAVPGVMYLRSRWGCTPVAATDVEATEFDASAFAPLAFDAPAMWRRLLPYAAALWAMNIVMNLFGMSDRYMILHWMPGGEDATRAAVGQYHSARIVPLLLTSLATMVSGVLMPYLAADWENGLRQQVVEKLRITVAAISVLFTLGGGVTLLIAPWLFNYLLQGRYEAGLSLMPMAMLFCIWSSLAIIAQNYLWVAERGKWVGLAVTAGLIGNVALNAWLLPSMGLYGAVVATTIANAVVLGCLWIAMAANGYRPDRDTVTMSLLPATLLAGGWVAVGCAVAVALSTPAVRQSVVSVARIVLPKFGIDVGSIAARHPSWS